MKAAELLLQAQSARFAGLDRRLPPAATPPDGDVITAALPDGERVAGVLVRTALEPGAVPTLWSALEVWELHPLLGDAGRPGMDALLRDWRRILDRAQPGRDSSCVVTWPSRDAQASRPLLDHGFLPLSAIAVRDATPPEPLTPQPGLSVRRAGPRDLDTAVRLGMAELTYSALVGGAILRPDAEAVKRAAVTSHLEQGDPAWLAERDGIAVGLAECWFAEAEPGSWTSNRLLPGRWGYVNCVSVLPDSRGTGVGQQLMAVAHAALHEHGVVGTFLYHNPPNPLASVFWARQGYRPLWTIWEVRPASALR
jgi:GNAT superfamily N-acetyltransferase